MQGFDAPALVYNCAQALLAGCHEAGDQRCDPTVELQLQSCSSACTVDLLQGVYTIDQADITCMGSNAEYHGDALQYATMNNAIDLKV